MLIISLVSNLSVTKSNYIGIAAAPGEGWLLTCFELSWNMKRDNILNCSSDVAWRPRFININSQVVVYVVH